MGASMEQQQFKGMLANNIDFNRVRDGLQRWVCFKVGTDSMKLIDWYRNESMMMQIDSLRWPDDLQRAGF